MRGSGTGLQGDCPTACSLPQLCPVLLLPSPHSATRLPSCRFRSEVQSSLWYQILTGVGPPCVCPGWSSSCEILHPEDGNDLLTRSHGGKPAEPAWEPLPQGRTKASSGHWSTPFLQCHQLFSQRPAPCPGGVRSLRGSVQEAGLLSGLDLGIKNLF